MRATAPSVVVDSRSATSAAVIDTQRSGASGLLKNCLVSALSASIPASMPSAMSLVVVMPFFQPRSTRYFMIPGTSAGARIDFISGARNHAAAVAPRNWPFGAPSGPVITPLIAAFSFVTPRSFIAAVDA